MHRRIMAGPARRALAAVSLLIASSAGAAAAPLPPAFTPAFTYDDGLRAYTTIYH